MSHHSHSEQGHEVNEADSRADAIAILCLILLAVVATVYFVSGQ